MHKLYDLKENLCRELEEYSKKDVNAGNLEIVDKLSRTIKNLDKILNAEEGEYNEGRYNDGRYNESRYNEGSYRTPYQDGYGARGRGRNARRDSRGRYAEDYRGNSMVDQLYELMNDAPDERTRQEIQRMISGMENK